MNKTSFSFPREWILKSSDSFSSLYRGGSSLRGGLIAIYHQPAAGRPFRVGFSTRKKLGNAVCRNRARRLMREAVRLHQHRIRKDIHCLLVWHGPIRGVRFAAAEEEILGLFRRGGLLK